MKGLRPNNIHITLYFIAKNMSRVCTPELFSQRKKKYF